MKKVLSIVLSLAMVICLMPTMAFAGSVNTSGAAYADTAGTPCEGAVNVLSALGMVNGYEDGTYKPEQTVTRAEMAKLIITALGVADYASATTSSFNDMSGAEWAVPFVEYAANLKIVNGYGDGRFGPSDTVTYEQAVTMIVRALGYTDECNEMNGSWPAIYVQKAMALGIFADVANGGSKGADRGDVAIMLYNSLNVPQVYANQDGTTNYKQGNATINGVVNRASIMSTLNKNGDTKYQIITKKMADTALVDVFKYVGMVANVTFKNNDVLAVGDIKSEFITGDLSADGKTFTSNNVKYDIDQVSFSDVDSKDGNAVTGVGGTGCQSYVTKNSGDPIYTTVQGMFVKDVLWEHFPRSATSTIKADAKFENVTISAKVSGTTIKEVYGANIWEVSDHGKMTDSDVATIEKNKKIFGKSFKLDDDQNIDNKSFILYGVDSLSEIQKDDIVYIYTVGADNKITRVDVGRDIVTGVISRVEMKDDGSTPKNATIDGKTYKISDECTSRSDFVAGNEVEIRLNYEGKIYKSSLIDSANTNYALVVSKSGTPSRNAADASAKVQLVTSDGRNAVYNVDGAKILDNNGNSNKSVTWGAITAGAIVKYSLNDSGVINKIYTAGEASTVSGIINAGASAKALDDKTYYYCTDSGITNKKISKTGFFQNYAIADNATIFTAPVKRSDETTASYLTSYFSFKDADDITVVSKNAVLDTDVEHAAVVINEKDQIISMLIIDTATSDNKYGIVTKVYSIGDNKDAYSLRIGDGDLEDDMVADSSDQYTRIGRNTFYLYNIQKTAGNKYKLTNAANKSVGDRSSCLVATCEAVGTSLAALKVGDGGYLENSYGINGASFVSIDGKNRTLADDVVVYVYDKSDDNYFIGGKGDLNNDDNQVIYLYETAKDSDENYGLVNYVTIYRK